MVDNKDVFVNVSTGFGKLIVYEIAYFLINALENSYPSKQCTSLKRKLSYAPLKCEIRSR